MVAYRRVDDRYLVTLLGDRGRCEQLAQGCYAALPRVGSEPTTC